MKRPKINFHLQVSLSSGKSIKCRISLFSGVEITMRPIRDRVSCFFTCEPYLSDRHSCRTGVGSISLFKPFAKICRVCNIGRRICWKHGERKHEIIFWEWKRTKRESRSARTLINTIQLGKCVCMVFTHSLVCIRNLTRSLRSLVRFLTLNNSLVNTIRIHFPSTFLLHFATNHRYTCTCTFCNLLSKNRVTPK